jgi:ABC-type sugar transport system substrate-binding protein
MKMTGKRFAMLCCALVATVVGISLAAVMLSMPQLQAAPKLVLVTDAQDPYQQAEALGAEAAAEARGVELEILQLGDCDAGTSAARLNSLVHDGVNGVVITQGVGERAPLAVRELAEKTKVITCGEDAWPSHRLCHVGTGDYSSGRMAANVARAALSGGGRVIVLVDDATRGAGAARLDGFRGSLRDYASWLEVVETFEDLGHVGLCARNMRRATSQHADVTCIVDLGDRTKRSSAAVLARIAEDAGVKLITFDRSDAALAAVEAGSMYAVIGDDPFQQGYQAVDRLASFCREGEMSFPAPGRGHVHVPASVVRKQDAVELGVQRPTVRRMPTTPAALFSISPLMLLAD